MCSPFLHSLEALQRLQEGSKEKIWYQGMSLMVALQRQHVLKMSFKGGRDVFWHVLMTLCMLLLSASVLFTYHAVRQYVNMLSIQQEEKAFSSSKGCLLFRNVHLLLCCLYCLSDTRGRILKWETFSASLFTQQGGRGSSSDGLFGPFSDYCEQFCWILFISRFHLCKLSHSCEE